jgi:hypothetical protein
MRIIGDPDNQPPDKWSSIALLKHVCIPSRYSRRNFCPFIGSPEYVFSLSQTRNGYDLLESLSNTSISKHGCKFYCTFCIFYVTFFSVVVQVFFKKISQIPTNKMYFFCVKSVCLSTLAIRLSACLISAHMASSWHEHVTRNESFLQLLCFMHTAKTMGKLSSLNFA